MALLNRDRTKTDDTVAGPGTSDRPDLAAERHDREAVVVRKNSFGQTLATILATIILVAVVAVAIANTDEVDVDLLFDNVEASLSALVGGAAGAGFLIGALLGFAARRRRQH